VAPAMCPSDTCSALQPLSYPTEQTPSTQWWALFVLKEAQLSVG